MTDRIMNENYRYYRQKGDTYILKRNKEFVIGIFWIIAGIVFYYDVPVKDYLTFCFALLLVIWGVLSILKRKVFNVSERILTISYGGFFRKTYKFNQFQEFVVREETFRQRYNGMGVRIVFKKKFQLQDILLRTFWVKDSIEPFIIETKRIVGKK